MIFTRKRPTRVRDRAPGGARALAALALAVAAAMPTTACSRRAPADELLVFAAASLSDALTEIGREYRAETGTTLVFNFAGSNVLAQQLLAAPDADLFLSANEAWMDRVEAAGFVEPDTRRPFVSNRLVVVAHSASTLRLTSLADLADAEFRHLALGDPEAVPAGLYARQLLVSERLAAGSLWDRVEERVVPAPDVRAALGLAAATPDTVAIVYASDVIRAAGVRLLLAVPEDMAPAILYSAAVVRDRRRAPEARAFLEFLCGPRARELLVSHGFSPLP